MNNVPMLICGAAPQTGSLHESEGNCRDRKVLALCLAVRLSQTVKCRTFARIFTSATGSPSLPSLLASELHRGLMSRVFSDITSCFGSRRSKSITATNLVRFAFCAVFRCSSSFSLVADYSSFLSCALRGSAGQFGNIYQHRVYNGEKRHYPHFYSEPV